MGRKTIRNWQKVPCPDCKGNGYAVIWRGDPYSSENIGTEPCPRCKGSGSIHIKSNENKKEKNP